MHIDVKQEKWFFFQKKEHKRYLLKLADKTV